MADKNNMARTGKAKDHLKYTGNKNSNLDK